MTQKTTTPEPKASSTWERLEHFVREHVQRFIQALLEEEVTELLGRTKSARREAVAAPSGYRNGYGKPWRCTIADGHLGLWAALGEQDSTLAEQRCWNHRITKVLDALPKKYQAEARTLLCAMPYAETQTACETLRVDFTNRYRKLVPKAVERLADDWERLVTFYQFPR